jgi:Zn-dependent protease/CBS domain-containing protein
MIAVVAHPPVRRRLPLPDGRTAILVERGSMTLYAHGLEIAYGPQLDILVESPTGSTAAAAPGGRMVHGAATGTTQSRAPDRRTRHMNPSVSLGRIAGVPVGLNWSVFVIAALLVWTLAAAVFPEATPDLGGGAHLAMAVVAAVVFLASILLHELGHAVQARRDGMQIEGITLWLFGGVARFRGMFPSAGAEFRIAVAGPVVSLALGLVFLGIAAAPGLPDPAAAVASWLGVINLVILVFNLLPAFPLDGGRILRAALWKRGNDFVRATEQAAAAGRAIAYGLIALGVLMFIVLGAFGGAWLAFIGWFLLLAASAESRAMLARQALEGLTVGDVMAPDPVTASPRLSLDDFMDDVVWRSRHTTYPVVDDERAVGLIPFRRVAEVPRAEWSGRRVGDCMVPASELLILDRGDDLAQAAMRLGEDSLGRALVLDSGRLVGLLSITDVMRALELRGLSPPDHGGGRREPAIPRR